ncbi:response regulator transcription factor [Alcaligenaceae bacterium]|nr:response regulator transcription factor [Alcaligenaceae bacterium]
MVPTRPKILIVENDFTIAENLYSYLEIQGYEPDAAYDGHAALTMLANGSFDAIILDIGLPGIDGYRVLQMIKKGPDGGLPVLMLTARAQLEDKLAAFTLGADDYLVKPFALAEVHARLQVMLRRGKPSTGVTMLAFAGIVYDIPAQTVAVHGRAVHLTKKSRIILELLLGTPNVLVSRQSLQQALWPDDPPSDEAVRSQLHLLRKALQETGFDGIETVHGLGWKIVEPSV